MANDCTQCGGQNGPTEPACRFCGATTPYGAQQQHARFQLQMQAEQSRQQMDLHADWKRHEQAERVMKNAASQSLIWSLVGLVLCTCFPLPALVGFALGVRSWSLAKKHQLTKPASGVAGIAVSAFTLLMSAVMWAWFGYDMVQTEQRKAALKKQVDRVAQNAVLDHATACKMLELELESENYEGYHMNSSSVDCVGQLEQTKEGEALLRDARMVMTGGKKTVFACFKRGARWYVNELRPDAKCGEPLPSSVVDVEVGTSDATTQGAGDVCDRYESCCKKVMEALDDEPAECEAIPRDGPAACAAALDEEIEAAAELGIRCR